MPSLQSLAEMMILMEILLKKLICIHFNVTKAKEKSIKYKWFNLFLNNSLYPYPFDKGSDIQNGTELMWNSNLHNLRKRRKTEKNKIVSCTNFECKYFNAAFQSHFRSVLKRFLCTLNWYHTYPQYNKLSGIHKNQTQLQCIHC